MKADVLQVKRTGDFYYPIYFEDNFDGLADSLRKENLDGRSICIVTDTNVAPLYAEQVQKVLAPVASYISVPLLLRQGNRANIWDTVQQLIQNYLSPKNWIAKASSWLLAVA